MEDKIREAIDDLNEQQLEQVLVGFLTENNLAGEFLVWVEKWKAIHSIQ